LRYFSRTELLELPKDQDLPVFYWEFNNCFSNDLCGFSASERVKRRFAGRSESIEIVKRPTDWARLQSATGLQRFIRRHPSHPRAKAGF
jgi:hypothetical protein